MAISANVKHAGDLPARQKALDLLEFLQFNY